MDKKKICIFFLLCCILAFYVNAIVISESTVFDTLMRLIYYPTNIVLTILMIFLIPFAALSDVIDRYMMRFNKNIVLRIGIQAFHKQNIIEIIKNTIFWCMIFYFLAFLIVTIFVGPHFFKEYDARFNRVFANEILNYLIFVIASCIGFCINNVFLYICMYAFNNRYLIYIFPVIYIFFINFISIILNRTCIRHKLLDCITPLTMIYSFQVDLYPFISYFITVALYFLIDYFGIKYLIKEKVM